MGNVETTSTTKKDSKISEFDEEQEVREFEKELGISESFFKDFLQKLCLERDLIEDLTMKNYISKSCSSKFLKFIEHRYFKRTFEGKTYYDGNKIRLLFFSLTKASKTSNSKISYCDKVKLKNLNIKASYVFCHVKNQFEDSNQVPITRVDKTLDSFLEDLINMATRGIIDGLLSNKENIKEKYRYKLRRYKDEIKEKILDKLFNKKLENKSEVLSFEGLNKFFVDDPYVNIIIFYFFTLLLYSF
jgi:hypothetical protein